MGHGDLDRVIAGGNGGAGQAVALGAQHDGKLGFLGQLFVVDADRTVTQGHGSRFEAQRMELLHPLFWPVGRRLADLRPGHLKDSSHAHPHRPAAERVTAGGVDEDGVHVEGRCTAEDGPHVGRIHNALQNSHPPGIFAEFFHGTGCRTAECAEHAPGKFKARQSRQQLSIRRVNRSIPAAGQDFCRRTGDLFALHQKGERLIACIQRPGNNFGALGNKDAFLRLQTIAQLVLGQPGVGVQLRGVKIGDLDDIRHRMLSFGIVQNCVALF